MRFVDTDMEESNVREYREMLEAFDWEGLADVGAPGHLMLVDDLRRLSDLRYRVDPSSEIWFAVVPLRWHRGLSF